MRIRLCVERGSYLGLETESEEENRKKYCKAKKDAKRVVHVSCNDGRELFRIAKQEVGKKRNVVGFSCLKDESDTMKVSVDD